MSSVHRMLGVLTAVVAFALVPAPQNAADPEAKLPVELQYVPADAAIFGHVDVAALRKSPLGVAFKATKLPMLDDELKEFLDKYKVAFDDVGTVTGYITTLDGRPRYCVVLTTVKEYDRKTIIDAVEAGPEVKNGKYENKNNVIRITPDEGPPVFLDLSDAKRIVLGVNLKEDPKADPKRAAGLHSSLLKQSDAVLLACVNLSGVPEEVRRNELPFRRELQPLSGIVLADSVSFVGKLTAKELTLTATVRSPKKEQAADVRKAFETLRALGAKAIDGEVKEFDLMEQAGDDVKEYRPLFKLAKELVKAGKIDTDGTNTTAAMAIPTDAPFGPYVELLTGARTSKFAQEKNNLREIGIAIHSYHDAFNSLPPAHIADKKGKPLLSWRVLALPYLEQENLYKAFKLDEPWESEHNMKVFKDNPMPPQFLYPGDKAEDRKTRYRVFIGKDAGLSPTEKVGLLAITDGTSNTICAVTAATGVPWTKPEELEFDPAKDVKPLLHFRGDRCNVLVFDGSIRPLKKAITEETLRNAITRSDGNVLGSDW